MAMMKIKGFTLAELLIVIVILGILGGIALPRFYPQAEKAHAAEAVSMLSAIRQGELAYHLESGEYLPLESANSTVNAKDWAKIGIDQPPDTTGSTTTGPYFAYSVTSDDANTMTATAMRTSRGNPSASVLGMTITLDNTGTWGGSHPNVPSS